jgi:hypothetical protein
MVMGALRIGHLSRHTSVYGGGSCAVQYHTSRRVMEARARAGVGPREPQRPHMAQPNTSRSAFPEMEEDRVMAVRSMAEVGSQEPHEPHDEFSGDHSDRAASDGATPEARGRQCSAAYGVGGFSQSADSEASFSGISSHESLRPPKIACCAAHRLGL